MKILLLSACLLLFCGVSVSQDKVDKKDDKKTQEKTEEEKEREKAKKVLPFDKGPDKLDVSSYPKDMQDNYKLFSVKCSQCHTLARPINAPFKTEDWNRYVKRMMRKPGSGIKSSEGKKIYEFLKYYSEIREKEKKPDPKKPEDTKPEEAPKDGDKKKEDNK